MLRKSFPCLSIKIYIRDLLILKEKAYHFRTNQGRMYTYSSYCSGKTVQIIQQIRERFATKPLLTLLYSGGLIRKDI